MDTVLQTHKATKDEMKKGIVVVYRNSYLEYPVESQEDYRSGSWRTGRITNTDELFKDLVEISGRPVHITKIRIIDSPVIK